MEAIDRSEWLAQAWAQLTASSHYQYQDPPPPQRSWYPTLPPSSTKHHYSYQTPHSRSYLDYHAFPSNSNVFPSNSLSNAFQPNSNHNDYYSTFTASTSPSSQHLSPPAMHHLELLSYLEPYNIMGSLDTSCAPSPAACGEDHWHQFSWHPSEHHYRHEPSYSSAPGPAPSPPFNLSSLAPPPSPVLSQSHLSQSSTSGSGQHLSNCNSRATLPQAWKQMNYGVRTGQRRVNHVLAGRRRRSELNESFHILIQLLAENGGPLIEMMTNGRPRCSIAKDGDMRRSKNEILLLAVELVLWLEEGNEALREEVAKMEGLALSSQFSELY